jgi:hypothetical protein
MTQAFNLSQLANKVNSSGQLDGATGLTGTITSSALSITGNSYLATSSGNVGVGTNVATYNYQTKNIALYDAVSVGISVVGGSKILTFTTQSSGGCFVGTRSNDDLKFTTNDIERMRIDPSGNLLIARTTILSAGRISIDFDQGANQAISMRNTNAGNGANYILFLNSSSNQAGLITQTGATTVAYTTTSDYRLKENIAPMTGALDNVLQLKPVTYNWKIDGSDGQGFIAHELQAIVPECVTGEKDAVEIYTDEDGIEQTRPVYQGVDTSFLVATLTAAIQEQQTIINDLKARIETLESK